MNQMQITAARTIRSAFTRRALRAATVAGVAVVALGTAGSSFASTSHHMRTNGFAATEECLSWSGTIQYFPALTTTSHAVTAVLHGTLSNCSFDGIGQTFSGTVFGDLTGTAIRSGGSVSGTVAITWPQDANLNPTISPISVSGSANKFSFSGTVSAGAGTGQQLEGSYDTISTKKIPGGSSQSILGSAPFGLFINEG
ncbi:MAG TPA: hypothetical protein VGL63_01780 [Streptosporangiaceae bacterium]|jgi:hypothetical protein